MQATQPFVIFCSLKWSIRFSPSCLLDAWVLFGILFLLNKSWFRYFVNLWKIQIFSASNRIQLVGILNQFTHHTVGRHVFFIVCYGVNTSSLSSLGNFHLTYIEIWMIFTSIAVHFIWTRIDSFLTTMRLIFEMKSITFPGCHNFHKSD